MFEQSAENSEVQRRLSTLVNKREIEFCKDACEKNERKLIF